MKKNFLLATLFFYFAQTGFSQSGQLDPAFGNQGIVKSDIGAHYDDNSAARQVFIQADGSMYIILDEAIVTKRHADGSIDSSYGFNGYSRSLFLNDAYAAIQADSRIVIAGSVGGGSYGVVRVKTNGSPDSTFGINGVQNIGINPRALAVQSDGKIVVAGYFDDGDYTYFSVVRYDTVGHLDNTFNGGGQVTTDIEFKLPPAVPDGDSVEYHEAFANTLAIQADDKIVVGGHAYTGINYDFAVVRYKPDGVIDSTFNDDGIQTTNVLINEDNSSEDNGNSLAIQSDGKIVLGGYATEGSKNFFTLVRYKSNGDLDSTFDEDGKQIADFGFDTQIGNSVVIQSDGKILLAGYAQNGTLNDFAVARFNTNGELDDSFDGDGMLLTDFISSDDYASAIVLQDDGKMIVAGYAYISSPNPQRFALVRYNNNGSLDNSFDDNGKLEGNYHQGNTVFNAIAIQADKKVIAAGQTWNGSEFSFAVTRLNDDGTPDSTFDGDGNQVTDFDGDAYAYSVVIQNDGKIIVAGDNAQGCAIVRYNTDGSLDNTFNGTGKQTVSIGYTNNCRSIALQQDGKIVLAGTSVSDANLDSNYFAVVRLNTDGSFDNTFSEDGKQLTNFGSYKDFANAVAIQNDGKIVVAGRSNINGSDNFSLARYNTDGSLDTDFSQDGKQVNTFGGDLYVIQSLAIQNDGGIVVAGNSEAPAGTSSAFTIARYKSDGDLDNSFSDDGFQTTALGGQLEGGKSVAINVDGKIAVAGITGDYAVVLLYNANGSLDNTFSEDGIQITNVGVRNSLFNGAAFANNKLYAAGAAEFPQNFGIVARYLLPAGPVPVSLLDFKGNLQNKSVLLQWKIATEKNVIKFIVERSADGNTFSPIYSINAYGTSTAARNYSTLDKEPLQGINFYRLKMIDIEGAFTYSNVIAVKINGTDKFVIFPNPAKDILFVLASGDNENTSVRIFDATGRKVREQKVFLSPNTSFSININDIQPGVYRLVIQKKDKAEVRTFIKK